MIKNFFPTKNKTIAVGLSGGVDSALSAALLKEAGYKVSSFHFHLFGKSPTFDNAKATAKQLNIPFLKLDLKKVFKAKVIKKIIKDYSLGKTPNPCILCNKSVRFPAALDLIKNQLKADFVATGHYARIVKDKTKTHLVQAKDLSKDQSYFLYQLNQNQLDKLVFPLGDWLKKDVWLAAKKRHLPNAQSRESFDVCFTHDLSKFLKQNIKCCLGEVVTIKGEVIGQHQGLALYTIGSRGGWAWLSAKQRQYGGKTGLNKWYVVAKDIQKNQLVVGNRQEASQKIFNVQGLNIENGNYLAKIRNTGKLLKCQVKAYQIILDQPAFGITPGQSAVFYRPLKDSFEVVGGGEIQ